MIWLDDMDDPFELFRVFSASLEKLRQIDAPKLLFPERVNAYHSILEDAYSAYGRIETAVDALGQQLEEEHQRLDKEVERYGNIKSESGFYHFTILPIGLAVLF